MNIEIVN